MSSIERVAVVGGGVSGIAAAHVLRERGIVVEIIEAAGQLGGRIALHTLSGRPIELGGKNIGHRYRHFRAFAKAYGDPSFEHVGINTARVANGKLLTIDASRRMRSFVAQLRRRSPMDLGRFGCLALRVRWDDRNGFLGGPGFRRLADRTGDPTVASCFSEGFCQDAWRPMSLLMNAAEPDELHVGNLGTNVAMALDDYDQLTEGMGPLLDRFAATMPLHLGTTVEELAVQDEGGVVLTVRGPDGRRDDLAYDAVVLALTAPQAAALVAPLHAGLAAELKDVRYFPTAVVVASYDRDVFRPDVRALRFDEGEALGSARAYGKDELDVVRYTFSGRSARPLLAGALDGEALLTLGEAQLGRHLPVAGRQAWVAPERALSLCAYGPHHGARLDRIKAAVATVPGVHLTGDYVQGASIEACFRAAHQTVAGMPNQSPQLRSPKGMRQNCPSKT